jgi:hypothetical protein
MTVYALLVGINDYASDRVRSLNGCVRDVECFGGFQARTAGWRRCARDKTYLRGSKEK